MLFGHTQRVWALLWKNAQQGGYKHNNLYNFIQSSSPKFSSEAKYQLSLKQWLALTNLAFKGSLANIPPCPSYFLSLLRPEFLLLWQPHGKCNIQFCPPGKKFGICGYSLSCGVSFRVNASVFEWWLWRVKRSKGRTIAMNSCLIFQEAVFSVTYLITPLIII